MPADCAHPPAGPPDHSPIQSSFSDPDLDPAIAARLKPAGRAADGRPLVTAVAQSVTGEVLMVAWMDAAALARTISRGEGTYYSRSRNELWVKGLTSGHTQRVREVRLDCDGDAVLLVVEQVGGACHTGDRTCFDADLLAGDASPTARTGTQ